MYGCDYNLKGCLSVSAYRLGGGMNVSAFKPNADLSVEANRIDGKINVSASIVNDRLDVSAKPIGKRMIVTCSLVCSVSKDSYLNVNPDYVWLTPDMISSGEFDITSNVSWNIV